MVLFYSVYIYIIFKKHITEKRDFLAVTGKGLMCN